MKIKQIGMLVCASSAAMASVVSVAQNQQARPLLEEIVITAEKREATLSDTAVAITAFTSDTMSELNISDPSDYQALVPSLSYRQDPNRISIRGVGRFSNSLGVNPGVAIYNDYAYTAEATALGTRPLNTERVEILRGPQGTLYGRNTTGGAVNIITKRPPDEWAFEAAAKVGNYATKELDVLVGGPIAESLRFKLYANDISHDGYMDNAAGEDIFTNDTSYIEGQVSWDITDTLNLFVKYGVLKYDYISGQQVSIDGASGMLPWDNQNLARSATEFSAQYGLTAPNPSLTDPYTANINDVGSTELNDSSNITVHLTWDTDFAEIKYIANSNEYSYSQVGVDSDGTPSETNRTVSDVYQIQDQQTHELQFVSNSDGSVQWLAGLYAFKDENEQPFTIRSLTNTSLSTVVYSVTEFAANPDLILYHQNGYLSSKSKAAYGELSFDLSDTVTLTTGLRYSDDEMSGDEVQVIYANGLLYGGGAYAIDISNAAVRGSAHNINSIDDSHSESWDNWSGHLTLDYSPTDDHLFWAKLATGYKMGGFRLGALQDINVKQVLDTNAVAYDSNEDFAAFDPEEVTMLEFGWKGNYGGILQLDAVLFAYDYSNLQQLFSYVSSSGVTLSEVVNTDMEMFGLEFGVDYLLGDYFRVRGNYSYNTAEFTESLLIKDSVYGVDVDIKGNRNDQTPEHKLSLNGSFDIDTSAGFFYVGLTASYVDERFNDIFNREETTLDSYTRFDLLASWSSLDERYRVTAAVKNLTEAESFDSKDASVIGSEVPGGAAVAPVRGLDSLRITGQPIQPRLFTIGFEYKM